VKKPSLPQISVAADFLTRILVKKGRYEAVRVAAEFCQKRIGIKSQLGGCVGGGDFLSL
jgi:hypothetical protein